MASYSLSHVAERDLEGIYAWGAQRFGVEQAERYAHALAVRLREIAASPQRWPVVPELLLGCRRSVIGSHAIYYEMEGETGVFILRVLGRQDASEALG